MNIVFVSHCDFRGNSAMHIFSVANALQLRGHDCVVLVPGYPETIEEHGEPLFQIAVYDEARARGVRFSNRLAPDIIHAWSPRHHVATLTKDLQARYGCPYLVHMEDNEEEIVATELALPYTELATYPDTLADRLIEPHRSRPAEYRQLLAGAAGVTSLIQALEEFKPEQVPGIVFWPGFDDAFAQVEDDDPALREELGLAETDIVILYSGNIHASVAEDIKRLFVAIGVLRRRGHPVRLVRTGMGYADLGLESDPEVQEFAIELGFVKRDLLPRLVAISDILVQPGRSDAFNDYRFPSKIPEYLVSGRPVILPNANIGRSMTDGCEALLTETGTVKELCAAIERLIRDPELGRRIGRAGRAFAVEHLSWTKAAAKIDDFYQRIGAGRRSRDAATDVSDSASAPRRSYPVKLVAFYLPQFHPIPENDRWWGKGFTEWTNVALAKPSFQGHQQPRTPADLGFYDLRLPDVMHQQAALARSYGVGAFCFYYYWFNGRRLLETPLDNWMKSGPDFPFCICWANESWSRRWDGSDAEVLLEQVHEADSDERFIRDVAPILKDERYLRVNGAPVLLVYRVSLLHDSVAAANKWRQIAASLGIPRIHLCAVQSFGLGDPRPFGFDAAIEFSPPHIERQLIAEPRSLAGVSPAFQGYLEDYISVALRSINAPAPDYVRYRGLFPMWDNTARRKRNGHVLINDSPKAYAHWLRFLVHEAMVRRDQVEPLVFVNAWNEWAEGTYLEPDQMNGHALLEVTQRALEEGVVDFVRGHHPERERSFTEAVSRLPVRIV